MSEYPDIAEQMPELLRKVDEIHTALFGDVESRRRGLVEVVEEHDKILFGDRKRGAVGVVQQIGVIWKSYVWILCTLSAGAASAGTLLAKWVIDKL